MSARLIDPLATLRQRFAERLAAFQQHPPSFADPEPMRRLEAEVRVRLGDRSSDKPMKSYLTEAVRIAFMEGPRAALDHYPRHLCWALTEAWGAPPKKLIEQEQLFSKFLLALEHDWNAGDVTPSAWRGLLDAYFDYRPPTANGAEARNWQALRDFLADTRAALEQRARYTPPWLATLADHANLLGEQPCERYAAAVIAGDRGEIDALRERLNIPQTSWLWSELLLSQTRAVCQLDDQGFVPAIAPLLESLAAHPLVRDSALVLLLERYGDSGQRTQAHAELRNAAIDAWGSPHFERNSQWGLLRPQTRHMVRIWLTRLALSDFFKLLQEDRAADLRRLKFWLRYQSSIEYFHFALGPDTFDNQSGDYREMRKTYREQISAMTTPGSRKNNAFTLKINDYYFVEFGATGNALYCYHQNNLPFSLNSRRLDLKAELKVKATSLHTCCTAAH